jgi:WhiB family transcriptional regulator, redox-sensing transcriptional regulator
MNHADVDWRYWAACRDEDPDWFFPTAAEGTYLYQREVQRAKDVCRVCPVIDDCLREAVSQGRHGVWGGTDEPLRRWLRKPRPGAPKPSPPPAPAPALSRRCDTLNTAAQARQAIREGMSVHQAAAHFEVTLDTARRWRRNALKEATS